MAAKSRKSVPLSEADLVGLAALRSDLIWKEAAMEFEGVDLSADPSEAEALGALVAIGRRVVESRAREKALDEGYAALAASRSDEDRGLDRVLARRAADRSPDE